MHLLLPPSETKAPGGRGRPLHDRPPHPQLGAARAQALAALADLVRGPAAAAAQALLLPPGVAEQALQSDATVVHSATTPALRRYRGVVYDGLDHAGLDSATQRLAGRSILVFSGLFGVVQGNEPIPDYRVPAKAVLPDIGVAGTFWRRHLTDILPGMVSRGLIVDLRSGDYAAMWRAPRERTVAVRVLSPLPRGGLGVISYASKFAKGRLAAALLRRATAGDLVNTADDVAATWVGDGGADARTVDGGVELITG